MMDVRYRSTRNSEVTVTASQAILKGLADDGADVLADLLGLFRLGVDAGADGPQGLIGDDDLAHLGLG